MSKKKKIIILSVMAALLVVTGYLNIALNNNTTQTSSTTTTMDFYDSYRADREESRETAILYYDGIIADQTSSEEAKKLAEESRQELVNTMETELIVEGLIKGVGFENVVLTTSTGVNVILKASAEELTDSQIAQVATIVQEQTKQPLKNIRIIPAE